MIVPFGEWTPAQCAAAQVTLESHPAHVQKFLPFETTLRVVWRNLEDGVVRGAFIGGYLSIYDVGPTWCSDAVLLHEYVTMRAMPGGTFKGYIQGLRYIAHVNNCVGIITGNGVLRPGLRKLYEQAGFVKQNEAYFLGVQHGRVG